MLCCIFDLHSYISGHYNPSARIIDLASHIIYVACIDFMHEWQDLQFNIEADRQIF